MSNEAMRLPSGEVNSSVHYQKMFALSKTLNSHTPLLPELIKKRQKSHLSLLKCFSLIAGSTATFRSHYSCSGSGVLIPKSASSPKDAIPLPIFDE